MSVGISFSKASYNAISAGTCKSLSEQVAGIAEAFFFRMLLMRLLAAASCAASARALNSRNALKRSIKSFSCAGDWLNTASISSVVNGLPATA